MGRQAEFKDEQYGVIDSIRFTIFGTERESRFQV